MTTYHYLKALHLISMVAWFAGLFYIVRLFIYHVESEARPPGEKQILQTQFAVMERRLWYGITWPAMIATAVFGVWLMILTQAYAAGWFHLKLAFLALLFAYHWRCGRMRKDLRDGSIRWTSRFLRIWNEVATILLFAIVFAAVLKTPWGVAKGMLGLLVFTIFLLFGMRLYRSLRPLK